ncbi:MAG TPA: BolA family protein [Burkholderiales bacterium]|nr:BolA family protein [Burkholderiales bacterium]
MPTEVDSVVAAIEQRLARLEPELLEIYDESGEHVGHAGARDGGGHYQVLIVSRRFEGESRIGRHRMVYQALDVMLHKQVHALSITALTPQELQEVFPSQAGRG